MRVGIAGAGVAGALLAWRLCRARVAVDVYAAGTAADATGASGGLVRGFERDPDACRLAAASLVELRGDPVLREWAGYREIGSMYLLPPGCDPAEPVRLVEDAVPGSIAVRTAGHPFQGLPSGTIAVTERHAGYLSPAGLRSAMLGWLAGAGVEITPVPVVGLDRSPAVRLADGTIRGYDAVVLATGAWTPTFLAAQGLGMDGFRTKQIQYNLYSGPPPLPCAFVDDSTGLHGRPAGPEGYLLGLPCDHWDVDPSTVRPDTGQAEQVTDHARHLLGPRAVEARPHRTVAAADCYHDPPGLALRPSPAAAIYTFTAGSGGAAKTVLAASRAAATALLGRTSTSEL